jgi:hypothetical protein
VSTVIAETRRGPVETEITDLSDRALRALAGLGHPEAIREYWRRELTPGRPLTRGQHAGGWLSKLSARIERGG